MSKIEQQQKGADLASAPGSIDVGKLLGSWHRNRHGTVRAICDLGAITVRHAEVVYRDETRPKDHRKSSAPRPPSSSGSASRRSPRTRVASGCAADRSGGGAGGHPSRRAITTTASAVGRSSATKNTSTPMENAR